VEEWWAGELVLPARVPFRESGLLLSAEVGGGQKTGFYCDQRENRLRIAALASGRTVLDLFAHAGAFGLYALSGGARAVVQVESSARFAAVAAAARAANGLDDGRATWVTADVFADLRSREERYGVVVCDPPPLARRAPTSSAPRAPTRTSTGSPSAASSPGLPGDLQLQRRARRAPVPPDPVAAAVEAGTPARLLAPLAAAPDHPVSIAHPEASTSRAGSSRSAARRSAAVRSCRRLRGLRGIPRPPDLAAPRAEGDVSGAVAVRFFLPEPPAEIARLAGWTRTATGASW